MTKLHIHLYIKKLICCVALCVFTANTVLPVAIAQTILDLPAPGKMLSFSPIYVAPNVKGIKLYPENPLRFDFIIDSGDGLLDEKSLSLEAEKMAKYFLAAITIPGDDMWVNLSPYENDRIVTPSFGITEMGRDLLAQDYVLKQITASMMFPDGKLGERFWKRVYEKAYAQFGTTNIPVNSFNKVWIIPDHATVYTQMDTAMVIESRLKVMLDSDYTALKENMNKSNLGTDQMNAKDATSVNDVTSQIVREIMIPELEKEVNEGENFAKLRQIYNAIILATWYKKNLKENILNKIYVSQNKTSGIDVDDKNIKDKIYDQYLQAFKKGVYDVVKEEFDPASQEIIPRRYFSGGALFTPENIERAVAFVENDRGLANRSIASDNHGKDFRAEFDLTPNLSEQRDRSVLPFSDASSRDYSNFDLLLDNFARATNVDPEDILQTFDEKTIVLVGIDASDLPKQLHKSLPKAKIFIVNPNPKNLLSDKAAYTILYKKIEDVTKEEIPDADLIVSIGMLDEIYVENLMPRGDKSKEQAYSAIVKKFGELLTPDGKILILQGLFENTQLPTAARLNALEIANFNSRSTPPYYFMGKKSLDEFKKPTDRSTAQRIISLDDNGFTNTFPIVSGFDNLGYFQLSDQTLSITAENLKRYTSSTPLTTTLGSGWKEEGRNEITFKISNGSLVIGGNYIPTDSSTTIYFPEQSFQLPTDANTQKRVIVGREHRIPKTDNTNTSYFLIPDKTNTVSRQHLEIVLENINGVATIRFSNALNDDQTNPRTTNTYFNKDKLEKLIEPHIRLYEPVDVFAPRVYEKMKRLNLSRDGSAYLSLEKTLLELEVNNLTAVSPLVVSVGRLIQHLEIYAVANGGIIIYDGSKNAPTDFHLVSLPEDGEEIIFSIGRDPTKNAGESTPFKISTDESVSKTQLRIKLRNNQGEGYLSVQDVSSNKNSYVQESSLKRIRSNYRVKSLLERTEVFDDSTWQAEGTSGKQDDRHLTVDIKLANIPHGFGKLYAVMAGHSTDKKVPSEKVSDVFQTKLSIILERTIKETSGDVEKAISIAFSEILKLNNATNAGSTLSLVYLPVDEAKAYWGAMGDSPIVAKQREGTTFLSPLNTKESKETQVGSFPIGPESRIMLMTHGALDRSDDSDKTKTELLELHKKRTTDILTAFIAREVMENLAKNLLASAARNGKNKTLIAIKPDKSTSKLQIALEKIAKEIKLPTNSYDELLKQIYFLLENNPTFAKKDVFDTAEDLIELISKIQNKNFEDLKKELIVFQKLRSEATKDTMVRAAIEDVRTYNRQMRARKGASFVAKNQNLFQKALEKGFFLEQSVKDRLKEIDRLKDQIRIGALGVRPAYNQEEKATLEILSDLLRFAEIESTKPANKKSDTPKETSDSRSVAIIDKAPTPSSKATVVENADRSLSQAKDVGGIDVNPDLINMKTEGSQIKLNVTNQLRNLEKMSFDGFKPNLIQLVPANLPAFLGLQTTSSPSTQLSSVK